MIQTPLLLKARTVPSELGYSHRLDPDPEDVRKGELSSSAHWRLGSWCLSGKENVTKLEKRGEGDHQKQVYKRTPQKRRKEEKSHKFNNNWSPPDSGRRHLLNTSWTELLNSPAEGQLSNTEQVKSHIPLTIMVSRWGERKNESTLSPVLEKRKALGPTRDYTSVMESRGHPSYSSDAIFPSNS